MSYMFYKCESLKELDLSNFNTNNVTDMTSMFHFCKSLELLNIDNFNTNKLQKVGNIFTGCEKLKNLRELKNIILYNDKNHSNDINICISF